MNLASFSRVLVSAVVVVVGLTACPRSAVTDEGCKSDLDCGASQTCNVARGLCLCIDDNACDASEFCNLAGSCQAKLECLNNSDCRSAENPSAICDTTSGECLSLSAQLQCVLDSQCPFGSFCNDQRQCQTGCEENGDCPLGEPCLAGQCDPTAGACNDNSFCSFGEVCNASNRCVAHADADQLCQTCGPNAPLACPNDCLLDSSVAPELCNSDADCARGDCLPSRSDVPFCFDDSDCNANETCNSFVCEGPKRCQGFFCGASGCDDDTNPCPRGYSCFTLQAVSGATCDLGSGSTQCGAPRSCVGGGENGNLGICSCASDGDCPAGTTCQNPGPTGACITGTTCGPSDGLLCEDVR